MRFIIFTIENSNEQGYAQQFRPPSESVETVQVAGGSATLYCLQDLT